jgi:DnaJ-class molecular chaperone
MKATAKKVLLIGSLFSLLFGPVLSYGSPQSPDHDIVIKVREHTKLQPVIFSHATHVERQKIECTTCHHKDPAEPKACTTCHNTEGQGKAPSGKDALHRSCERCHDEQVHWKCHDCHHKP